MGWQVRCLKSTGAGEHGTRCPDGIDVEGMGVGEEGPGNEQAAKHEISILPIQDTGDKRMMTAITKASLH